MRPLNSDFRNASKSPRRGSRPALALAFGALGAVAIIACGSSTGGGGGFDNTSSSHSSSRSTSNATGTKTTVITTTSTGTTTLADGGVITTTTTGTTTTTITTTNTPNATSSGQTNGTNTSSSNGTGGNPDAGDGGGCTNTDPTSINIDSSGWVCNNQYKIQGAWYCYNDGKGTSPSCTGSNGMGQGAIPFDSTKNAMCISGTTSTSTATDGSVFGAGIGLVLNAPMQGSNVKNAFNAKTANIVGFAITVTGSTGGSVLNVNFPTSATANKESPAVTLPALTGTSSTTFNVMIGNSVIVDNPSSTSDPTQLTDVQVAVPSTDGMAHAYNYCVTKIVPLMAAPGGPTTPAATSLSAYGAQFNEGKQVVLGGVGPYGIQNDPFNVGTDPINMTVSYGGGNVGFVASPTFGNTGNTPGAFPAIVSGWVHGGAVMSAATGGYPGTTKVGSLMATSSWSWTASGANYDAAYDIWVATNPGPVNAADEIMIWVGHSGVNPISNVTQPTAVSPAGATNGPWTVATGTVTDSNMTHPVVSYVAQTNFQPNNFNIVPFIQDAINQTKNSSAPVTSNTVVLSVQAGFEVYGMGTYTTSSYNLSIK